MAIVLAFHCLTARFSDIRILFTQGRDFFSFYLETLIRELLWLLLGVGYPFLLVNLCRALSMAPLAVISATPCQRFPQAFSGSLELD